MERSDMKVVDMHCDTITELWGKQENGIQTGLRKNDQMVDLERLTKGGYLLQNFAIFVEQQPGISSFDKAQQIRSVFQREMKQNTDRIAMVTTIKGIEENEQAGKLSALLTVEGGEACEGSLEKLHVLYEQGVRMMTLTWNYPNEIGYPNLPKHAVGFPYVPDTQHGLTPFGIECVKEMERIGMIIDVSHLSDAGFYDVLRYTKKPFVASHSNARAVCPWVRNLTDDMIRKLADRGGVTGLNFCGDFLLDPFADCNSREQIDKKVQNAEYKGYHALAGSQATFADIVRHARHMINVGGIECIGLGSDFDGIPDYPGCPRADRMDDLAEAFHDAGFTPVEIEHIFYRNVLRLYHEIFPLAQRK